jgi:ATP-dependent DNA helicase RecG
VTTLATSLVSALGKPTSDRIAKAFPHIRTVGDLMAHYPRRYVPGGELSDLRELEVGEVATVVARVSSAKWVPYKNGGGERFIVTLRDTSGSVDAIFFAKRRVPYWTAAMKPGERLLFAGTVERFGKDNKLQLKAPVFQSLTMRGEGTDEIDPEMLAGPLMPLYPAAAKLPSWSLMLSIRILLDTLSVPEDPLPAQLRGRKGFPGLLEALRWIHHPESHRQVQDAQNRLKYDEALALQVALAQRRADTVRLPAIARPPAAGGVLAAFDAKLPFELTDGQRTVGAELAADLAASHPMHRLLSGEVGSGKTVVALRAMLQVVDAGGQAALLAPTEVLAAQHFRSLRELLGPLGRAGELDGAPDATTLALLTGSQGAAARRTNLALAAGGQAGIVVGTHALLTETVQFADLGLVVVDEQHRFGVEQRDALRSRGRDGTSPHVLVMTATPIPRTVAMTVFGDLETSALTELPRGRQPIRTILVDRNRVARMWEVVREQVAAGRQAFVVCPRIETSDKDEEMEEKGLLPAAAVEQVLPELEAGELRGLRVGMLHGRMHADDKDAAMLAFAAGRLDVLVATTVVEVGVDVPNATVMVILDADRFGVSQLHQLRGRVGRGEHASLCFLHSALPPGVPAVERLRAVAGTDDGVELARVDLQARGEGDVLGVAQSGSTSQIRLLRLLRDEDVIAEAREVATAIVADDPALQEHPALRLAVEALVHDPSFLEKG